MSDQSEEVVEVCAILFKLAIKAAALITLAHYAVKYW